MFRIIKFLIGIAIILLIIFFVSGYLIFSKKPCGGFANIQCAPGYSCVLVNDSADIGKCKFSPKSIAYDFKNRPEDMSAFDYVKTFFSKSVSFACLYVPSICKYFK